MAPNGIRSFQSIRREALASSLAQMFGPSCSMYLVVFTYRCYGTVNSVLTDRGNVGEVGIDLYHTGFLQILIWPPHLSGQAEQGTEEFGMEKSYLGHPGFFFWPHKLSEEIAEGC